MNLQDITAVVAVDGEYMKKLLWSYQTWVKFKPEILKMKLLVIYDKATVMPPYCICRSEAHPYVESLMNFKELAKSLGQDSIEFAAWDEDGFETQRAKMLTSLVFGPAEHVKTKWYLKLDADTFANENKPWIKDEWFAPKDGKEPVFIASPWGYTKPKDALDILDNWGDTVESLKGYPRLNIPYSPDATRVCSPRMASWVFFGNTEWLKEAVKACPDRRLPVPSQDTFLYYVAARRGDHYVRERMSRYGWSHASKFRSLKPECERLLNAV